jgi:hypothetical protein
MIQWLQNSVAKAHAPQHSIIDVLVKNMGGYQKARSHKTVHASDITKPDFCPRKLALLDITGKDKKDEYISTALQATFDLGNAVSDLFREQWAGQAAHGFWQCPSCGWLSPFGTKPSHICNSKQGQLKYIEPRFVSKEYGISGSLDVVMNLGAPKLFVTELKIIAPDAFDTLAAPLSEHRIRTGLYLKIIEDDDNFLKERINLQEAKVCYVSRGHGRKHPVHGEVLPFREFDIKRDDAGLQPILEKAKAIKLFRDAGTIPAGICNTMADKTAKNCQMCSTCFSGEHKAGATFTQEKE